MRAFLKPRLDTRESLFEAKWNNQLRFWAEKTQEGNWGQSGCHLQRGINQQPFSAWMDNWQLEIEIERKHRSVIWQLYRPVIPSFARIGQS